MTGIVGGTVSRAKIEKMADSLYQEPWYENKKNSLGEYSVGISHHGEKDSQSSTIYCDDNLLGAIYGVISNKANLPWTTPELLRAVIDSPDKTLPKLDGPFLIAVMSKNPRKMLIASDKVGSRPCYYATGKGLYFGSELKPLLPYIPSLTVNHQAVSDLLLFGTVVGEKTILEEISSLPPATYISMDNGDIKINRYWNPKFNEVCNGNYTDNWMQHFEKAMENLVGTIDGQSGLWLSGGIDSRVTGENLRRLDENFEAISYRNGISGDIEIARRVAENLDVQHNQITEVVGTGDDFVQSIKNCIDCNDAMQSWAYVPALSFMFHELNNSVDVVMEGGTFLGEDIWSYYAKNEVPPEQVLYHKRKRLPADKVASIVPMVDDPQQSLREEIPHLCGANTMQQSCDAMRRMYSYLHMRSNVVQRSQVGTRTVSDGALLNHVLNMPPDQRMQTVPGTKGRVPFGVPPIKLRIARKLKYGLDDIPYQRTGFAPRKPYWLHAAGFIGKNITNHFIDSPPGPKVLQYWQNDRVRSFIDGLISDARNRPFFNGDELLNLRDQVLAGESTDLIPLGAVSGLECWLQRHIDPIEGAATHRQVATSIQ